VGIPAYNEENNIASIITKLKKVTDSIIVCDDGSSEILIKASSKGLEISEVPILDIKERFK
tara:strand:+ start:156 stop:338 length:183 start_codon:yes stop_codon:yes gene_type:complete